MAGTYLAVLHRPDKRHRTGWNARSGSRPAGPDVRQRRVRAGYHPSDFNPQDAREPSEGTGGKPVQEPVASLRASRGHQRPLCLFRSSDPQRRRRQVRIALPVGLNELGVMAFDHDHAGAAMVRDGPDRDAGLQRS
jgi:hypothetical protein